MNAPTPAHPKAVVYTRISVTDVASSSLASQDAELRSRAALEGWDIVATFADDGVSGGKQRENATEALAMLADGRVDLLGVYAYDRWSRQGVEFLADLIRTLRLRRESGKPARFVAIREGVDGNGSEDNFDLRLSLSADQARAERDRGAARMRVAIAHRHAVGKHTGGAAPLGYRTAPHPDGGKLLVIDDSEAALIRVSAERLLAEQIGVAGLAREFNVNAIPTAKSPARLALIAGEPVESLDRGIWDATTVRRLFTSDRIAGRVTHHGHLVLGADGLPAQHYPAVLDASTVERIRLLVAPASRPKPTARPVRLLSGIARCSGCLGKLHAGTASRGAIVYRCPARGCPKATFIRAEAVEKYVADRYLAVAGKWPEVRIVETVDRTTANDLADVEAALADVRAQQTAAEDDDQDDLADALRAKGKLLRERRRELRARPTATTEEAISTGRTIGQAWTEDDNVEAHRIAMGQAVESVVIAPATKPTGRAGGVDLSRVSIQWHPSSDELGFDDDGISSGPNPDKSARRAPRAKASA